MGKTYLVERVRQALPTVAGYDDCDPDQAQALLESGTPSLATLNIRHYELVAAPPGDCLRVPLTPVIPRACIHGFENPHLAWNQTLGHPFRLHCLANNLQSHQTARWREALVSVVGLWPTHIWVLESLLNLPPELNPAQCYEALRREGHGHLKEAMDRWACAGLLSRMIFEGQPGVWYWKGLLAAVLSSRAGDSEGP